MVGRVRFDLGFVSNPEWEPHRQPDDPTGTGAPTTSGAPRAYLQPLGDQLLRHVDELSALREIAAKRVGEVVRANFEPAQTQLQTGVRDRDDAAFRDYAKAQSLFVVVRHSNPASLQYIERDDVLPKPMNLKAKTLSEGPGAGLVGCPPERFTSEEAWKAEVKSLAQDGFYVGPAEDNFVIRDAQGRAYHADYDLHGLYALVHNVLETGGHEYQLNLAFGKDMIQHPPHDLWDLRNTPGPNQGPRPPATAYLPDGSAIDLQTPEQMRELYKLIQLNWESLYPN